MSLEDKKDTLKINNFILTSSREVNGVVSDILKIVHDNVLVHIVSYMHNTVLVQTLKNELEKRIAHARVVLLKSEDRTQTFVTVYTLEDTIISDTVSDEILNELYIENSIKKQHVDLYRNKLLSRYFTDHLTNLPNVYQLRKDLDDNEGAGLVIFNIDNFKTINNFYGFIVGDYVIEEVGLYLKNNIETSKIYRLSADEFAIVLNENMGFYDLKKYLSILYQKIKNIVVTYQDIDIFVDLTLASCSNSKNDDIFSKVSMALKYAKEKGVPFWIYEDRMRFENEYERNLKMSALVRDAVEKSKIIPFYQAISDNNSSEITKYECLARMIDENEKIISPLLFIPIAKKIKVYNTVTKNIIDASFKTFENNEFEFSINLSIEDIMSSQIFKYIIEKLKNSKASKRVTFELLESEAIQDFKIVERFITEVKRHGAKIAIDDFGSGYSNFSYLTKMSIDFIKIDGSLIKDIDVDKNAFLVVETIVKFAKKLGVQTVAEYVHSSTVLNKVKDLGIDYSQGFYIDEPSIKNL